MKKFLTMLSLVLLGFASTSCYDDSKLWDSVNDLDARVETLENLCTQMNSNLTALTELINAMTMGDVIIGVTPVKENGVEVGYQLLLKDGGIVVIYHGKNGKDGADGKDGTDGKDGVNGTNGANGQDAVAPEFGVKKDTDGVYYWTLNGEFVVDSEGNKVPVTGPAGADGTNGTNGENGAEGVTPQLKIEEDKWFVSYDNGVNWDELGDATNVTFGECLFEDVKLTETALILTMADGETISVPIGNGFKVVLGEFDATALQYGSDLEIPYTIEGAEGEVVVFLLREGDGFAVELVEEKATSGKVIVSQLEATATEKKLKVGIFASGEDGTTVSKSVRLVSGVFATVEGNQETYAVEPAGGKVEFKVATNTAFEVKIEEGCDWITYVPQTKAVEEVALSFEVAANQGEDREATVEVVSGDVKLSFTVTQEGGYTFEETLVGAYKIQTFWVYGGTGPGDGGAGWVDLHNKAWWFDQETGHGIAAERNNYLEFTLTGFNADNTQSTGKCINWAGTDGKNWSCWFHNAKINDGVPTDGNKYYRQIPIGESTWVRDYTVTPNTVTFTDAEGNKTVLEILEPGYQFVPGYGDKNAANNTRTFPRTEGDDLTFHAKITTGKDNWNAIYNEIDKVYDRPRDFFIDVNRVEEIPADAKTTEAKYTPALPEPETPSVPTTLAGTYKYSADKIISDSDTKGLIDQYGGWSEPLTDDGRAFNAIIKSIQNDVYVFTATGTDANGNETGTVSFNPGDDGTWNYKVMDNQSAKPYTVYDVTELYGFIAHDNTTTYVYDAKAGTITFTTRGNQYVVDYLVPGTYTYSGKSITVNTNCTFAMHYDMGFTQERIANYKHYNGLRHVYSQSRHWVLSVVKQ